jgi:hypothetical protein
MPRNVPSIHLLDLRRPREKISSARSSGAPRKWLFKMTSLVLLVALFATLTLLPGTNAWFADSEKSAGNALAMGALNAEAVSPPLFSVTGMVPGNQPSQDTTFKNIGSLDFKYKINYRKITGDDALCDVLLLTATRNGTKVYDKQLLKNFSLADFSGTAFSTVASGSDGWNFILELPTDAGKDLENKPCQFNFDFTAWQTDLPDASKGFFDEETAGTHVVATGDWLNPGDVVINEVMWMGSTASDDDEWIELRNMTGNPINIGDWTIEKAATSGGTLTIPSGTIPANGFFLIANYNENDSNSALNVSPNWDTTSVELLNSNNGELVLKNGADLIVDKAKDGSAWPAGNNGTEKQSMERENIPGDGTILASWHTCISGNCNDGTYWDTAEGNNYGTPGAANLSPVVMNEFVANPIGDDGADRPNGEWIELYNISGRAMDVSGWYFKNSQEEKIVISKDNVDGENVDTEGRVIIPEKDRLVVYLEKDFLDNEKDTLSFFNDLGTPADESDDVREDTFEYKDAGSFPEGKSIARFPDGVGIWIDPEATPGEKNKLGEKEADAFRLATHDKCFDAEGNLQKNKRAEICAPAFLEYLGMIGGTGDKELDGDMELKILEMKKAAEEKKMAELIQETAAMQSEPAAIVPPVSTDPTIPPAEPISGTPTEPAIPDAPPVIEAPPVTLPSPPEIKEPEPEPAPADVPVDETPPPTDVAP